MASPLDLLIPPRLIIRAADDLHRLVVLGERALGQLERLEQRADRVLTLGERIEGQAEQILSTGERIGGQAERIIGLGERIGGQADEITELGTQLEALGRQMLDQGTVISDRAEAVASRAGDLVDALPTIEQAVTMVSPLEGAVERFGRAVDRLPGGRARAALKGEPEPEGEATGPEADEKTAQ